MLPPNKAAPMPLHPFDNSVAKKIKAVSLHLHARPLSIWASQPHPSHRKSPLCPRTLQLSLWAKEIVCGQQSHNNPWQVSIAILNPKSQRHISSLLFIVTARVSSCSLLWLLLFFKATGSCYCLVWVEFLQFVLSAATLRKALGKHGLYFSSPRCQLPLAAQVSGIFQHKCPPVSSFLIWQLIDLSAFTLHKLFAMSGTFLKSKTMRPKVNTF